MVALVNTNATEGTLNEYGRFDDLKATIDKQKSKFLSRTQQAKRFRRPK